MVVRSFLLAAVCATATLLQSAVAPVFADTQGGVGPAGRQNAAGVEAVDQAGDGARQPAGAAMASAPALLVSMRYVVPDFVGGAKVRTPEAPDAALAGELARRLDRPLAAAQAANPEQAMAMLRQGRIAAALTSVAPGGAAPPSGIQIVPTGYESRPMAIMRSDTDIKTWAQLKGRTVCLSEGGLYTGMLAARYGAQEKIMRAPADSLLALRTGGCDAAVHDETMLKAMLRLPEWKKFSATLPPGPPARLVFAMPADDAAMLDAARQLVAQWRRQRYLADLNAGRVRDIAFEVYLDQEVPDCH